MPVTRQTGSSKTPATSRPTREEGMVPSNRASRRAVLRGPWTAMVTGLMLLTWAGTAGAQLSTADIQSMQERGEREGWTFTVGENLTTSQSIDELCGLVPPENWWVDAKFDPCTPTRDLPASYDWRDHGCCPSVKNQGGCGSCWAFATVCPLECNIQIIDGI